MKIKFDDSRAIKIWFADDVNSPRVCVPVKVEVGGYPDSYICFKWVYSGDDRKLYMDDHLYFFDGRVHVGQISDNDQIKAYDDILANHIDIWMYLDLATRIMEANHEHPIEVDCKMIRVC